MRPVFKAEDWEAYKSVNRLFAEAVALEAPPDSSVFLNDYHLSLVAKYMRERRPLLRSALFWHIPWPDADRLRICPWRKDILEGLLSNDLLAFQLPRDQRNFLTSVSDELGASVSGESVYFGDRPVRVLAIPIGADFDRITEILADPDLSSEMRRLARDLKLEDKVVGVGVDRLDYTKGIPERMAAIDRLLTERPEMARRFVFVQIGVPSREAVPGYADIIAEIDEQVARINAKHGDGAGQRPDSLPQDRRSSCPNSSRSTGSRDFCIVSSLHDGMNLVAKEFVAARDDLEGVLILSELAGAAQELSEALIINPYDERGFTDAIGRALDMPGWERRRRMQALAAACRRARRPRLGVGHSRSARTTERYGLSRWVDTTRFAALSTTLPTSSPSTSTSGLPAGTCSCSPTTTARSPTSRRRRPKRRCPSPCAWSSRRCLRSTTSPWASSADAAWTTCWIASGPRPNLPPVCTGSRSSGRTPRSTTTRWTRSNR